jgi:CBS domain-containing protein
MTTIGKLLEEKGREVLTIPPDATVFRALEKMARHNIGALVVADGGRICGILTERHYAREVALKGRTSPKTLVGDIMTRRVICAVPQQTVEECMAVMTERGVRHLPVFDGENLAGIISIGDLVKSIIQDQQHIIEQLERYISG